MSAGYTRVTLVGDGRRVDMVLPAGEAVGRLMPELLTIVGDTASHPAQLRRLVTVGGAVLGERDTLAGAEIADGSVLRLAGAEDLPPAPIIHDVTEETADDLDRRATRWGAPIRRWVASFAIAAIVAVTLVLIFFRTSPGAAAAVAAATAVVLAGAGVACGFSRRLLGAALLGGAATAGLVGAWAAADAYGWPWLWRLLGLAGVLGVTVVLAGLNSAGGRAALMGGAGALGLAAVWAGAAAAGLGDERLGAVLAVVVVVIAGVLPRLALSWSGLAMLDDRRVAERPVARRDVRAALAAAHGSLVVTVVAAAVSAGAAGWLLAAHPSYWTVPLAVLLAVVLLVRARVYPLAAEVIALLGAASLVLGVLWWRWALTAPPAGPVAAAVAALGVPVLVLARDLPEHTRARIRRVGDLAESAAVVALLPLVLGVFGVYSRLLEVF